MYYMNCTGCFEKGGKSIDIVFLKILGRYLVDTAYITHAFYYVIDYLFHLENVQSVFITVYVKVKY